MTTRLLLPVWAGVLCLSAAFGQSDSLRWNEFKPRVMTDFGHIVEGQYGAIKVTAYPLNRNMVVLEQSARYGENWEFAAGFKGILWWPFTPGGSEPHQRTMRVDPRLSQAVAKRLFGGDSENFLEVGYLSYKYNPDARNLGEYLHRSETYPGIVRTTDGFHLMNHAAYDALGAHARLSQVGGLIVHDATLFSEPRIKYTGDLTPGYQLSLNLPLVQLGAGAAFNRLISNAPSRRQLKTPKNGYYELDSAGVRVYSGPYITAPDSRKAKLEAGGDSVRVEYYHQDGVKLMARAAVDLGFLIPESLRNPGDLRLFTEVALLGVEDQPGFYDDKSERIPVMVGANIPTFRMLDVLSVQGEYYGARYVNSKEFNELGLPVWNPNGKNGAPHDDWKWSVFAQRSINRLIRVQVQVANDHLRLPIFDYNISESALTENRGDWYYLVRLECGL